MSIEEARADLMLAQADISYRPKDESIDMAIEALKNQKKGHWILSDEQNEADVKNDNYRYICSVCGRSDIHSKVVKVPYCWFCGAKMGGE